jgi:hypothetical protein
LRAQLAILKKFVESFDFVKMAPSDDMVKAAAIVPEKSSKKPTVRVLAEPGKSYAIYINGGKEARLTLDLPRGEYAAEWVDTKNGKTDKSESFQHNGGGKEVVSPAYREDIALKIKRG